MTTRLIRAAVTMITVIIPGVSTAQQFDGLYRPDEPWAEGWRCDPEYLGADGGALGIFENQLFGVENTCQLTDPRPENGGVRYVAVCSGEGESHTEDYLVRSTETGITLTRGGETIAWRRCGEGLAQHAENEWVAGFGMGVTEVSTHDPQGNSVMLTCTGGQEGQVFVEFMGVPAASGPITFDVDGDRFEMTAWPDRGRLNLECRACTDNYNTMWAALRAGQNLTVTQGLNQARFSLRGSAAALDPVPCIPEGW
jgi:hypothetical protein